jgi:dihydrofolate reductase
VTKGARFILSLIVAVADNGVIGRQGGLPWRLGSDLRRFRKLTMGHPLIMGRKTFESIGKPLDGRDSIVVTRDAAAFGRTGGVFLAQSFEAALALAAERAAVRGVSEAFAIGGAEIFALALPLASRIYLTRVHAAPEGDARWQAPSGKGWQEVWRQDRPASERDDFAVTDTILERSPGA